MRDHRAKSHQNIRRVATLVGGTFMIIVIIWIDVATGFWQDLVILSGLAAGFVSFFLTSLVLKSMLARATAERWAPVNRLAITEFLHAIADNDRSEVAHGVIVPRSLPPLALDLQGSALESALRALRETVAAERRDLADALSRWADFLTTTGDNEQVLRHIARIAFQLDQVRDAALDLESQPRDSAREALLAEMASCDEHFALLVAELRKTLAADNAFELKKRRQAAA